MSNELQNKTVAILTTEGFEYVELTKPKHTGSSWSENTGSFSEAGQNSRLGRRQMGG